MALPGGAPARAPPFPRDRFASSPPPSSSLATAPLSPTPLPLPLPQPPLPLPAVGAPASRRRRLRPPLRHVLLPNPLRLAPPAMLPRLARLSPAAASPHRSPSRAAASQSPHPRRQEFSAGNRTSAGRRIETTADSPLLSSSGSSPSSGRRCTDHGRRNAELCRHGYDGRHRPRHPPPAPRCLLHGRRVPQPQGRCRLLPWTRASRISARSDLPAPLLKSGVPVGIRCLTVGGLMQELGVDKGVASEAAALLEEGKGALLTPSSFGSKSPQDVERLCFAFVLYYAARLKGMKEGSSRVRLWKILEGCNLNYDDFFKESQQFRSKIDQILRSRYGSDWEDQLEVG
ncbi:hypothetical protein QYE76_007809 [Lolium multiflorum]|uniref:Uncharacterized protein n=1 Tax=Lolium multiflorum TaxID=4521 RepID=A0AAD8QGH3_LOLMU|nr:hypothetical protein QYE76_007809 [Lolium multiflorum]